MPFVSGKKKYTRMKEQQQKNPCMGYKRHRIFSCNIGVASPTTQLKAQFVAVDSETPLTRTAKGIISGGYSHGIGPQLKPKALQRQM